jgi:2-polyprenyl-3-methyl-5-hydroxy-6-metoxy-1,4-benzoquinol methylase
VLKKQLSFQTKFRLFTACVEHIKKTRFFAAMNTPSQAEIERIDECPVCQHSGASQYLVCTDYTVSHEPFTIVSCNACGFRYTNPRPAPASIGRFYESEAYVSHTDTREGLVHRLYHAVKSITLAQKLRLVSRLVGKQKKTVLDWGCGTGDFVGLCSQNGWDAMGMEPDEKARRRAAEKSHATIYGNGEEVLNQSLVFEVITLWHVLEHVHSLADHFAVFSNLLSDSGILILALPNSNSHDAEHYGPFWAAYDVPRHLYHFRPSDVTKMALSHGFVVTEMLPMKFDAFYVSLLSERYKGGSSWKGWVRGMVSNLKAALAKEPTYSSQIYVLKKLR